MCQVEPDSRIVFLDKSSICALFLFSLFQDVGIHYFIPQTAATGTIMQHLLPFSSCLPTFPYYLFISLHAFSRFALSSLHINSRIHHFSPTLSTISFCFLLLDNRYGRSSLIIALYCRFGSCVLCSKLYFLVQVQSRGVELSRKIVATIILNKECQKSTSTQLKASFFLVHLF